MNYLVLKNQNNQIVRVFNWNTDKAFVVYRKRVRRLDILPRIDFLPNEKDSLVILKEINKSQFKESILLPSGHSVDLMNVIEQSSITETTPVELFSLKDFQRVAVSVTSFFLVAIGLLFFMSEINSEEPKEAEQRIVKIIKPPVLPEKIKVDSYQFYARDSAKKIQKKVFKKSLRRMSALGALGSLSKNESQQQGGLNLTNSKVSQGPGLKVASFEAGSGGVQSSIYSKGLITTALGSGGNVKGGGGYNTKGTSQGGGQAGYGKLNLVGSSGNSDLSESYILNSEGGAFDPNLIHQVISQKAGEMRNCYDEALKIEPSLKGVFSADFAIDHRGLVKHSRTHSKSEVQSQRVANCILGVINSIKFNMSSHKEPIRVIYKFDLIALKEGK